MNNMAGKIKAELLCANRGVKMDRTTSKEDMEQERRQFVKNFAHRRNRRDSYYLGWGKKGKQESSGE